ncbi:MAG: glycosyltransferase family 2 protein [Cytophagales bacterium]
MSNIFDISVVIPLFNEEESLPELISWIRKVMQTNQYTYEIVLIDDGSSDNSWDVIKSLSENNSDIVAVQFNRNYGKAAGLHIGFGLAKGKVVVTMDADLQDSPDEIPELYKMITIDGFDLVSGWKKKRYDNTFTKNIPSKLYNATNRWMSGIKLHDMNCGLKAYKLKVVKSIELYGEMHRYIPVIAKWNGFGKIGEKVVEHRARKYGVSKFGLERFLYGFLDLLSITFVTKFKKRPMHFFGAWGLLMFLLGASITLYLTLHKFIFSKLGYSIHRDVTEQPIFYIGLTSIILGTQMFLAGYIAELMNADSKKKNDYLISDRINN